ncbi:MAG: tRNA (N6-isopentenyl adenosine(37)-C2)-methylthiotransferase MiaB [Actinobacteria bacterium]|jgi:tRNA-2-methylthio-N6-dimethylallyladenosine synthase|nr:tRNA (N6-isopentenyl adenosine(37)-C2)-methylthiotransferase MiaB [Actinomycetota bacterium]
MPTFVVETYGCQMNVHDSERISGLLLDAGYTQALADSQPDLVVFNTCAVRENADNKLYGNLSFLAPRKKSDPNFQIAVGGCMAQKDKDLIIKRAPYVDVVFGTHNIGSLPILLERARIEEHSQVEIKESLEHFPSTLPVKRDSAFSAWVSVSVGCNNTCTFCIVPQLRGIEKDRPAVDIMNEVKALVDQGVIEITLLGQNVNAYGVDFGDRGAFAKLLRECGKVDGLERVRFMSPHPRDFTEDVIDAMAQTKNVMPHLHMPLQSGSDKILQAMRRSYRSDRYLGIIEKVRKAMPNAAITTDIIVGFPGESDDDFSQTIDLVKAAKFSAAYTFQYSKRPGTPAATMPDQVSDDVMTQRYKYLHTVQQEISKSENEKLIGKKVELLVSSHEGRHDVDQRRMNGRSADFRLTHFDNSENKARPGDLVEVNVVEAYANHIVAGAPLAIKKTKGAAAHAAWMEDMGNKKILLGIPTLSSLKSL